MKLFPLIGLILLVCSCNKNFYGTYNTRHWKDQSAFFQIKLNRDQSVEKTEIHTISNSANGVFTKEGKMVTCFFDSSKFKYPPDTMRFRLEGRRLYFLEKDGAANNGNFLLKVE